MRLMERYKENLTNQLFNIVGSANLLGNPGKKFIFKF